MAVQKVLTFRASSIGDCLMAKFFLENVHATYPEARCGIVVASRGDMIRDLLFEYPWIEVIEASRKDLKGLWRLWKRFHGSDIVLTQYAGKAGGTFSMPSKIAGRLLAKRGGFVGFKDASKWNTYLYDKIVSVSLTRAPKCLETDALSVLHIPVSIAQPSLQFEQHNDIFEKFHIQQKQYVVVHLFAGSAGRGMSQQKRQELLDALSRQLPSMTLVLTGSASERPDIEQLTLPSHAVIVAGELTLQELMNLIAGSRGMVSIGTGPSHIASHLGTPVIVMLTCIGIPWCGEDQYGSHAGDLFTRTDICNGHHDHRVQPPQCIENINMQNVAERAGELFFN